LVNNQSAPLATMGKPKVFYGYIVVAACFFAMVIIHGIVNTFGVFFTPLQDYFHTSREAISAANTVMFFTNGMFGVLMGILTDRLGPRLVLTIGAAVFSLGFILISQVSTLWQLYAVFIIIGIGLSSSDVVPLSLVVRWFSKKRGMMSGIAKTGTGVGMTLVPLITAILISNYGWRTAAVVLGILVIVIAIPLAQLLRRDPHEMGLLPDGEISTETNHVQAETGLTFRQATRTWQFWLVCAFYAALLFTTQSVLIHVVPYAQDLGFSDTVSASLVSVVGASSIAGRLVMGFSSDKIGRKTGFVISFVLLVISLSWLQVARELWMMYLFALIYGFTHGSFFAQISPLIAWLFGTRSQGTLLGVIIFAGISVGSVSPMFTGRIFDVTGSYRIAFFILLLSAILGLILITLLKPIRKKDTA
jgi:MFS family permease